MIEQRYDAINDAYNHLNALSKNKALYKPHVSEILKLKKYYFYNLKGLKKQLDKQHDNKDVIRMKELLSVSNLIASYYDPSTKLSDLEFNVNGVKVLLKDVPTPDDTGEYYFDNESLLTELIKHHEIELL